MGRCDDTNWLTATLVALVPLVAFSGCALGASRTIADADSGDAAPPSVACDPGRTHPARVGDFSSDEALPNVPFTALDAAGNRADFTLHDRYRPCGSEAKFLVLRIGATWCEPCKIIARSTAKWRHAAQRESVEVVDVLLANREQQVPTVDDLAAWRATSDADYVASTPERRWFDLDTAPNHIPYTIVIEKRSMHVEVLGHGWGWQEYPDRIGALMRRANQDNPWASFVPPALRDGLFDESEWEVIQGMGIDRLGAPPPDASNAVFASPAAAALGRHLFFDTSFSASGQVSCASCHAPEKNFGDDRPQSEGIARVDRHAPNLTLASYTHDQFWDGRADSLWMQALGPLENAKEMASSRGTVVRRIGAQYRVLYEAVFGPMPAVWATESLSGAMPGSAPWAALTSEEKLSVTGVFVNAGKAIAAYERTLSVKENALDRYARGETFALTAPERKGLKAFFHAGCVQCHAGPRLTDDAFHTLRFPTGKQDGSADKGRIEAFALLAASEFNRAGSWSDARLGLAWPADQERLLGAFKTPSLRGVGTRSNFGHGGTLATLQDVANHYSERGLKATDPRAVGAVDPWIPEFDKTTRDSLVPFLKTLAGQAVDPASPQ